MQSCHRRSVIGLLLALAPATASAQSYAGAAAPAMGAFGAAVLVLEDQILVGEPGNTLRPGIVYVYRKSGNTWMEAGQIQASDGERADGFGAAMATDGRTLAVAASNRDDRGGAIYFLERSANGWRETGHIVHSAADDAFGAALAISGNALFVGAPRADSARGTVVVYHRGPGGWVESARLTLPSRTPEDLFGASLATDGQRLFVGAPGHAQRAGTVVVFAEQDRTWTEQSRLTLDEPQSDARFGAAIDVANNVAIVAAPTIGAGAGAVFAFRESRGAWAQSGRIDSPDGPPASGRRGGGGGGGGRRGGSGGFGVDIAFDGSRAWIGSPISGQAGAAFVVDVSADPWTPERVARAEGEPRDRFGQVLAARGDVAAIALLGDDNGAGTVAIFERASAGGWTEHAFVESPPEALPAVDGDSVPCANARAAHFDCGDVNLLAFMPVKDIGGDRGIGLNDIWGWTDPQTNKEYAIVGRTDGTSFVDVTDPVNPVYIGNLPKTEGSPVATWRDMKVYKDHVFVVADASGAHGVQVLDLARLREFNGQPITFTTDAHYTNINSAHNIVINEASGFAYAVGSSAGGETCGGGLHMIDIREPKNPKFAGCFADPQTGRASTGYSHDAMCIMYNGPDDEHRGKEICFGSNETALSIADVSDKASPVALSRASYPDVAYSHQGWISEDQRYFFLDDELDEIRSHDDGATPMPGTRTLIWDVSDLDDPQLINQFFGATEASDHNLYIKDNLMYQSNYQAGLRVVDVSDPMKPVEVGFFDTVPYGTNTPGFGGSWSNYPFFKSGIVIVTSGREGLFIVRKRDRAPIS
ncbi:MAG: choice-of-anchor B family protein [Longimicrobiales bacterium]